MSDTNGAPPAEGHPSSLDNLNKPLAPGEASPDATKPAETTTPQAGDPPKPEGEKPPGEGEAPKPFDTSVLKLPEGFEAKPEVMNKLGEIATAANLTPETAQQLLDLHTAELKAVADEPTRLWEETNRKWADEVRADPEIGGDKFTEVSAGVSKVLDQYGGPKLREALDITGMGNHPEMWRFMNKVAKALNEGGQVTGAPPAQAKPLSRAEAIYGTQSTEQGT